MIVSINQPAYLPWLGYFHRIAISDIHIVLNHVQFEKNSFINRNKLRTKEGWIWVTVPIKTKGLFGKLEINTLKIPEENRWNKKHWASIVTNYSRAPYFEEYAWVVKDVYENRWVEFDGLTKTITTNILKALDIQTPILFSSDMNIEGKKDQLVLNLCKKVGATTYVSGTHGKKYLDEKKFLKDDIRVVYQDYIHPSYQQVYPGFEAYMSAIDLIFNCGPKSIDIIAKNKLSLKHG